jgi:hypothetical protein
LEDTEDVLKVLIEKGADIKASDNSGWTALHIASWAGNDKIVQQLIQNGAEPAARSNDGFTALDFATIKGIKSGDWYPEYEAVRRTLLKALSETGDSEKAMNHNRVIRESSILSEKRNWRQADLRV